MASKRELANTLIERLSVALAPHGFKFVTSERSWRKKTPSVTWAFHLAIIHHVDDFDVIADIAVRLEPLQRLLEDLLGGKEAAVRVVGGYSTGVEIGNLTIGQNRRWTVATAEDVEFVALELFEVFEHVALPYFREFSNPERAFEVLSGDDREHWIHAPLDHDRAIRAVALAFLLDRREEFEELVARKRSLLAMSKQLNAQQNLPVFDKVVEQLRARWAGVANAET